MNWLLFLHQIPPQPAYFRAKVMRRLNQLGAWPVKNSAYLLPLSDEALEDFEWLRSEVEQQGGDAWLFRSEAIGGVSDETIREAFRKLRAPDFTALAESAREFLDAPEMDQSQFRKLKRRHEELRRIDFFGAPGREESERFMSEIERTFTTPRQARAAESAAESAGGYKARTWVTRKGVKVDRIGSAWLIRRFIDPDAKFVFVDPENYRHDGPEIRFDMFEGEFTHRGDLCTFEVLVRLLGERDSALNAVAEVVHDIDLKESKYERPETAGIGVLIDGIGVRHADDLRRVQEGSIIFEALYAQMQTQHGGRE
jgi:hypothetical protein